MTVQWHHSSYKAFCSNHGIHERYRRCKEKTESRNWNEEAIMSMKNDMSTAWDNFEAGLKTKLRRIRTNITKELEDILAIAISTEQTAPETASHTQSVMETLVAALRHRKGLVDDDVKYANERFLEKLKSFHHDAFGAHITSLIGALMRGTYHAASMISGKSSFTSHGQYLYGTFLHSLLGDNSHYARCMLVTKRFGSLSLFSEHRHLLEAQFRAIMQELQNNLNTAVNQRIELVRNDLRTLMTENAILESERNPDFRIRLEVGVNSAKEEVEILSQVVANGA
jgi:hypothetical protein